MAIKTTLQTRFNVQRILIVAICLVMGLWGIYDYTVKIPTRARAYHRGQICLIVKQALEADPAEPEDRRALLGQAKTEVDAEINDLLQIGVQKELDPEHLREAIESIDARDEESWFGILLFFTAALDEAARRSPSDTPSPTFQKAYEAAKAGVNITASVSPPSPLDRAAQWMFIACLPMVPYFLWGYLRARRRSYQLDEDGTLHAPEGTWTRDEIADIDMSRWMAKSVAWVVHRGGARIKLDDYVHKNTHLIVGAIASRMYPDQWEADGRVRKTPAPGPAEDAG